MLITERYQDQIRGVISCYDRVCLRGSLPGWHYAQGMTSFLYANQIRIFDYLAFAQSLRDEVRQNAERIAKLIRNYASSKTSLGRGGPFGAIEITS